MSQTLRLQVIRLDQTYLVLMLFHLSDDRAIIAIIVIGNILKLMRSHPSLISLLEQLIIPPEANDVRATNPKTNIAFIPCACPLSPG